MIPQALTKNSVRNWVLWKSEIRGKGLTKVPYFAKGVKASCSQGPWEGYHTVQTAWKMQPKDYSGIGYVFTQEDGYLGIDIDACRNPTTGDLEAWAEYFIDKLKSYAEVSPSGTGVKIIVKTSPPPAMVGRAKRTKKFSQYTGHGDHSPEVMVVSHSSYFALTGDVVKGYGQIKRCQRQVNEVCEELWGKASKEIGKKLADCVPAPVEKISKWFDLADEIPVKDSQDGSARLMKLVGLAKRLGLTWEQTFYCVKAYEQSHAFPKDLEEEDIKKRFLDSRAEYDGEVEEDETVCADDLPELDVTWLWDSWLPMGALTVVEGDPGQGKSTICYELASRVSQGSPMPPEKVKRARGKLSASNVLILTAEDDIQRVVLKRLRKAKANLKRIFFMRGIRTRTGLKPIYLGQHLDLLRSRIAQYKPKLVMVDPLACFMDAGFDMHRDQSVRQFLFPLVSVAEEFQLALVMVRHLNKSQNQRARHRGSGSIGIAGAARSVCMVGTHPKEPECQALVSLKASLATRPVSQKFALSFGNIDWRGETNVGPDEILDNADVGGKLDYSSGKVGDWGARLSKLSAELGTNTIPISQITRRFNIPVASSVPVWMEKVASKLEAEKVGQIVDVGRNGRTRWAFQLFDR